MAIEFLPTWPDSYPELLVDLGDKLFALLTAEGVARENAGPLSVRITDTILAEWGGSQLYIPLGQRHRSSERAASIRAAFRGGNYAELARLHGVTVERVRQILRKAKS